MRKRIKQINFLLVLFTILYFTVTASAQEPPGPQTQESSGVTWQPPDIADLPPDWWSKFDTVSLGISNDRLKIYLSVLEERIQSLDAENLVSARNSLATLRSLVDFLEVPVQGPFSDQFEPISSKEKYTVEEVLTLRRQWRELEKLNAQLSLEDEQFSRQTGLLTERRDSLSRQYQTSDAISPGRVLIGLNRVIARVEFELTVKQTESLKERLKKIELRTDVLQKQLVFARENLIVEEFGLEDSQTQLADSKQRIEDAEEKIAVLQNQLLRVLSGESINSSLELMRKQQLTRASEEVALAKLENALALSKISWHQIRSGELKAGSEFNAITSQIRNLIDESLGQVEVWAGANQTTLISSPPEESLNAAKNFEIARTVARESLGIANEVINRVDDLSLMLEILAVEVISSQSGVGKAWARASLSVAAFTDGANKLINFGLFDIGDSAVTPGGIFKMLFIIVLAIGISWLIRHMLERVTLRKRFRNSPAIYTLGRLLHYIIIVVGSLIALGSIGIDFSSFALIAGALSVGIGFGLQSIVNNFVSGLILLFEGSLRVGDYIELDSGLAGVVREINTRATVVNTNDSIDVVVPNSELVTTQLTNWTLRESVGRIRIPFSVAYGTDKDLVKEAAMEAGKDMEFILLHMPDRAPQVRLVNFGDNALEFEFLPWLSRQGIRRPHRARSSFLWALDTKLKEAGIEVPYPQRDLHIRSDATQAKKKVSQKKAAKPKNKNDSSQ